MRPVPTRRYDSDRRAPALPATGAPACARVDGGRAFMKASRRCAVSSRDQILAAAAQAFGERGYDGTSTRAIADSAGMKVPLLFYHFKTKADLYIAAVQDQFRRLTRRLDSALAEQRT